MLKSLAALALAGSLAAPVAPAIAQTLPVQQPQVGVPPILEVQRLAPQLVAYYGAANLQGMVNGLSQGQPITLTTVGSDGLTRAVTFTPVGAPLTPLQIAQALESARFQLVSRGIVTPTGEQVAIALNGGALPTTLGPVQVSGVLDQFVSTPPATPSAAAGSSPSPAREIQQRVLPNSGGVPSAEAPRFNTSDSPIPRGTSDSPIPPQPLSPLTSTPSQGTPGVPPNANVPAPATQAPAPVNVAPAPPIVRNPRPGAAAAGGQ